MRNNSVKLFRIWDSGSGDRNHLCNFSRGHFFGGGHSCEIIFYLDQMFRCCLKKKFTDDEQKSEYDQEISHTADQSMAV